MAAMAVADAANEYLVAKTGVDTAENELSKVSPKGSGPKWQFPGSCFGVSKEKAMENFRVNP